jgi:hypothetical protein
MLIWKPQPPNYALQQEDAPGVNVRPAVILAGGSDYAVMPQKNIPFLSLTLDPDAGCTATVDFCFDPITDIQAQLSSLVWQPSGMGNITAASLDKTLWLMGLISAFRVNAVGGNCPVRGLA